MRLSENSLLQCTFFACKFKTIVKLNAGKKEQRSERKKGKEWIDKTMYVKDYLF